MVISNGGEIEEEREEDELATTYEERRKKKIVKMDWKRDSFVTVKRLAEFLVQPFKRDEENDRIVREIIKLCSFENLSNLEIDKSSATRFVFKNSDFFRKAEAGDWKKYLTTEMAAALDHKIKEKLHDSGLTFTMPL
ncbi:unnamed protein product [Dovyalis caffra]|uniref:Sulfotransferase n=1 Tax=Dovyalis caffra TaxID=77055 RepID=A0AAV1SD59_9ROSI|nr:unnamed protein product [Dovyalis caffra]